MILSYVSTLTEEIRLANGISRGVSLRESHLIDRYACEITAYLNGRIHQIVFNDPKN